MKKVRGMLYLVYLTNGSIQAIPVDSGYTSIDDSIEDIMDVAAAISNRPDVIMVKLVREV